MSTARNTAPAYSASDLNHEIANALRDLERNSAERLRIEARVDALRHYRSIAFPSHPQLPPVPFRVSEDPSVSERPDAKRPRLSDSPHTSINTIRPPTIPDNVVLGTSTRSVSLEAKESEDLPTTNPAGREEDVNQQRFHPDDEEENVAKIDGNAVDQARDSTISDVDVAKKAVDDISSTQSGTTSVKICEELAYLEAGATIEEGAKANGNSYVSRKSLRLKKQKKSAGVQPEEDTMLAAEAEAEAKVIAAEDKNIKKQIGDEAKPKYSTYTQFVAENIDIIRQKHISVKKTQLRKILKKEWRKFKEQSP